MSGGVDSAAASILLKEAGWEVAGLYLRMPLENEYNHEERVGEIASRLGIRLYVLDVSQEFYREVIAYFKDSYRNGLTPNPCVICNPVIKFSYGMRLKEEIGADAFSTGHYARIERRHKLWNGLKGIINADNSSSSDYCSPLWILKRAGDRQKDQSYFLYRLKRRWLKDIIFPLSDMTKTQVVDIVRRSGILELAHKESQEVCFIDGDYRRFLVKYLGAREGDIVFKPTGEVIGRHQGLWNYTIGQRRGINIAGKRPYYVIGMDIGDNILYVGHKEHTFSNAMEVRDINWLVPYGMALTISNNVLVKIRSRHHGAPARIEMMDEATKDEEGAITSCRPDDAGEGGSRCRVHFFESQSAITAGQSAVFYWNDVVVGGGIICG